MKGSLQGAAVAMQHEERVNDFLDRTSSVRLSDHIELRSNPYERERQEKPQLGFSHKSEKK